MNTENEYEPTFKQKVQDFVEFRAPEIVCFGLGLVVGGVAIVSLI